MKKFLIVDGNSILNRAFYGVPVNKMTTKSGLHTNAIYGFLNIYWMIFDKLNPDYVSVTFDLKDKTFRKEKYEEYKATRKKMPDELAEQMPVIKEVLDAMNIPILQLSGYEADDLIGTVAKTNEKNDIFTYILSGDRDSFQLISDKTAVVIPTTKKGITEYTTYTPEKLDEIYNIKPYQVIEVKALMGDSADNIPGVKGVGEKTAYSLIQKYDTIDNIYINIDNLEVSLKVKEKLVNDKEMAYLSHDLATIDVNSPIDIDYNTSTCTQVNKPKLYRLFKKLEFKKFLEKYDFSDIQESDIEQTEILDKSILNVTSFNIVDSNNIERLYDNIMDIFNEDEISYILNGVNTDVYVDVLNLNKKFLFGIYSKQKDSIYVIDINSILPKYENLYFNIITKFAASKVNKIGYNIKQNLLYFFKNNINDLKGFKYDIMIAYYLMDPSRNNYNIEYILNDLFNITIAYDEEKKENVQISLFEETKKEEFLTSKDILNLTIYLKGLFNSKKQVIKKLKELQMLDLFNDIEMPLSETLANMEYNGMYVDVKKLENFDKYITDTIHRLETDIYIFAGEKFNINSTQQLGHILFEKLDLPVIKKNKTGYSTNKEVLENLSLRHPIIDKILEYRQVMKLKSTYVDALKEKISNDGRIHTTFMQTVTSTGRLSSIEPNLQNIPVRTELGRNIRSFFVAEGNNIIIDADYSQIELRVLAHISKDETMINAFNNNIDIHKVTASQVFNVPLDKVTDTMRSHAKAVNFGIVYGISDFGLAKNISSTKKEAAEYIKNYLEKYHGIREFMDNIVLEATQKGYVSTLFGRRRYIKELTQKNKNVVQFGKRIAMNTPIQGTAADIIKVAMNKIYQRLKKEKLKSKLIMQVHDELLIEGPKEELEKVQKIMHECMENVIKLNVPLNIELNYGKSWFDAK